MKITWPKICFACQIPLDVDIKFTDGDEEKYFDEFMDFFPGPPNLHYNVSAVRRFNDGKFHPLCKWCFDHNRKIAINPGAVRDREIGKIKFAPPTPKGTTYEELALFATQIQLYVKTRRRHGDQYF
jgi:hypothetical protein